MVRWYLLTIIFLLGGSWFIPLAVNFDYEIHPFILNKSQAIKPEVYVNYLLNHVTRIMMVWYIYVLAKEYKHVHYVFLWCFMFFFAQYLLHYSGMYSFLNKIEVTSHVFVFLIFAWVCFKSEIERE